MKKALITFILFLFTITILFAQTAKVSVVNDSQGSRLLVNGKVFMINGMNWDYFPVGTNYTYSLWKQPDDFIKTALDAEMPLLNNMGVNTIRVYTGIQPKWIRYIYEKYGIYTMINHSFGRYGLTLNGQWVKNTDYSDSRVHDMLLREVIKMAEDYKNTPGLLLYLLGNENNYGLSWQGAETENIPAEQRPSANRAKALYKLFNEAGLAMKAIDNSHPVAICNGDLLFLDLIAGECKDIDILGCNMYRGVSFGNAFQKTKEVLKKPIMFTEFGADAFNSISNQEDQQSQAYYLTNNWREIYENAAGSGKAENCIGGFTFMFSDGWWKYEQTKNLDIHDTHASWVNGGYNDYEPGKNNMNEEWFGICAKGPTDEKGHYQLYPRLAYYALQKVHKKDTTMTYILKNKNLEIQIDLPLANYMSSRFDWTGKIVSVTYKNISISGTEKMNVDDDYKYGKGFYNEFGIDGAVGYDETRQGEWFHKIGVGLLKKDGGEYLFSRNYEIKPAVFEVTAKPDKIIICCKSQKVNGYSYVLTKEIELAETGFIINYHLKNTGEKTIQTNEYVHNFLAVNKELTGSDYKLKFPFQIKPALFEGNVNPEKKVDIGQKEVTFNGTPDEQFFFGNLSGKETVDASWELINTENKIGIKETGSFKTAKVNLWGWKHVISPELFFNIHAEPGKDVEWSRTYTVFEIH
ncbi:MAG: glycoside hydrolase family 2 TIM barrel-domain containing protein [Bacteroidales bacterium]